MPSFATLADFETVRNMNVLIVDDNEMARLLLENVLKNRLFSKILSVGTAEEALRILPEFKPDIIILDILMPGMNGLECCKLIRSMPEHKNLPILVQTAATDINFRVQAFVNGATDFVTSPIMPEELFARVSVHLQNRDYIKRLLHFKERMMHELNSACKLQTSILPSEQELQQIHERTGLDLAAHFEPSLEIGGDFWGVKCLDDAHVALWITDFSGHGVTAALNTFTLQAYLKESSPLAYKPDQYLGYLNAKLLQILVKGHFATMFYGVVNTRNNTLTYSCACSPNPILLKTNGSVQLLEGKGNLLGVGAFEYDSHVVPYEPGDTLLLYSDALIESPDEDGFFIEENVLLTEAETMPNAQASDVLDVILGLLRRHTNGRITDDLTLCVCKRA